MKILEVMSRDVEVIEPGATLRQAAERLRARDVGALPVCEGERIRGMLTDRDIVVRGLARGLEPTAPVEQVMTREVAWCYDDDDVEDAAELMRDRQIRRILVLSRARELVGILSLGDLATDLHEEWLGGRAWAGTHEPTMPHG
jgi:CBS domain-containing protein